MSYSRFSNADVYVFHNVDDHFECCACFIDPTRAFWTKSRREMISHMEKHNAAGHNTSDVIDQLLQEIAEEGDGP